MVPLPESPEENSGWVEVKPVIKKDTWRVRRLIASGYMPRPKPIKINPDKRKKRVMAKVLYNAGWGSKLLSIWFRTPQHLIAKWSHMPTPEGLAEFETEFKLAMKDYDAKGLYLVKEQMMKLIPEETNLTRLVAAGNFFKGSEVKNQTNIQNNIYGDLVKRYQPQEEIR